MATAATPSQAAAQPETSPPTQPPCWPKEWLDGATEIFLSTKHLKAYWDADIIDDDENPHDTIIESHETFKVCFRVQLQGRLWKCICGHWRFDLGFTAIGDGKDFNLSDVLSDSDKQKLRLCDWEGCKTRCIERCIEVPAGTIPSANCGTMYEVGAKFELRCCGDCDCDNDGKRSQLVVAGHERLGEYMFV